MTFVINLGRARLRRLNNSEKLGQMNVQALKRYGVTSDCHEWHMYVEIV